jgi:hypothetical protein
MTQTRKHSKATPERRLLLTITEEIVNLLKVITWAYEGRGEERINFAELLELIHDRFNYRGRRSSERAAMRQLIDFFTGAVVGVRWPGFDGERVRRALRDLAEKGIRGPVPQVVIQEKHPS